MSEDVEARAKAHYEGRRAEILAAIRDHKVSASMSGIEYYDRPWDWQDESIKGAIRKWVSREAG